MKRPSHPPRRSHHYGDLVRRWRLVARAAGLKMRRFGRAGELPLFVVISPALRESGGLYLSAGIHGDEPAGPEALIRWAEKNVRRLARWPLFILPCLNPWGLRNNIRLNADGVDLNRAFHLSENPVIRAIVEVTGKRQFAAALMLHEDYDGEGFYLYEIKRERPFWGEDLIRIAEQKIAIDPRARIEGRKAQHGLIRRRFNRAIFERMGFPEAIWLHEKHATRALTIETPSEFALELRVAAHLAVVEECVQRITTSA